MSWDAEAAKEMAKVFEGELAKLEAEYPDAVGTLRGMWRAAYLKSGHKILGRIVLSQTAEQACR